MAEPMAADLEVDGTDPPSAASAYVDAFERKVAGYVLTARRLPTHVHLELRRLPFLEAFLDVEQQRGALTFEPDLAMGVLSVDIRTSSAGAALPGHALGRA